MRLAPLFGCRWSREQGCTVSLWIVVPVLREERLRPRPAQSATRLSASAQNEEPLDWIECSSGLRHAEESI